MRCSVEFPIGSTILGHNWSIPAETIAGCDEEWFGTVFGFHTRRVVRDLLQIIGEQRIAALVERSSLGTAAAKAHRESVPVEVAERIVARADQLRAVIEAAGRELDGRTWDDYPQAVITR